MNSILALIEAQKETFRIGLPERCDQIEAAFNALIPGGEPTLLKGLHRLIHNIAGAGGTFGFHDLSELARPISHRLRERAEGPENHVLERADLAQFASAIEPLLKAMRQLASA